MSQIKCCNITLCKQFVNKRINDLYCKDCLFYFNYKLEFLYNNVLDDNRDKPTCPICLLDDKILYIKQKNCSHFTCVECIYDIYFNKDFFKKMPINPVVKLKYLAYKIIIIIVITGILKMIKAFIAYK